MKLDLKVITTTSQTIFQIGKVSQSPLSASLPAYFVAIPADRGIRADPIPKIKLYEAKFNEEPSVKPPDLQQSDHYHYQECLSERRDSYILLLKGTKKYHLRHTLNHTDNN
jgi:hypothetical protein